jgi:hypothetical protein
MLFPQKATGHGKPPTVCRESEVARPVAVGNNDRWSFFSFFRLFHTTSRDRREDIAALGR